MQSGSNNAKLWDFTLQSARMNWIRFRANGSLGAIAITTSEPAMLLWERHSIKVTGFVLKIALHSLCTFWAIVTMPIIYRKMVAPSAGHFQAHRVNSERKDVMKSGAWHSKQASSISINVWSLSNWILEWGSGIKRHHRRSSLNPLTPINFTPVAWAQNRKFRWHFSLLIEEWYSPIHLTKIYWSASKPDMQKVTAYERESEMYYLNLIRWHYFPVQISSFQQQSTLASMRMITKLQVASIISKLNIFTCRSRLLTMWNKI